ncbi:MAG: hypothetical protein HZA50_10825 [Planctomycetes bacterium]|nr:hypothetical protein [Planctomycetota bacterium]
MDKANITFPNNEGSAGGSPAAPQADFQTVARAFMDAPGQSNLAPAQLTNPVNPDPSAGQNVKASETQLKSLINDLHDAFKEMGVVPPPSRFGGMQLALSGQTDQAAAAQQQDLPVPSDQNPDVMKLMMVKSMTRKMAQMLQDGSNPDQSEQPPQA